MKELKEICFQFIVFGVPFSAFSGWVIAKLYIFIEKRLERPKKKDMSWYESHLRSAGKWL